MNNKYSLFIGRYQCPTPHDGHIKLIKVVLDEGKNACIALRKEDGTDKNPYTQDYRRKQFERIFKGEIKDGRVVIIDIPDIEDVCFGRGVGWKTRQIKLDEETESISATKIRENKRQ